MSWSQTQTEMRDWHLIPIHWVTVSLGYKLWRSYVTNKLMPIKIIVHPFISFTSTALLALEKLAVKSLSFENVDGGDG